MLDLLSPLTSLVAAVLATTHSLAGGLGLASGSAGAWLLAIVLLVVIVRTLTLPLVVHGVRASHARARATPDLRDLRARHAGARDLESVRWLRDEQRRINAEHGVSTWSLAPALLQLPLFYSLYRVIADLTQGHGVGALDGVLVASASAASVVGLGLASHLGTELYRNLPGALVIVALAVVAAVLTFVTQRWFVLPLTDPAGQPPQLAAGQRALPLLGAGGVLVAAWFVPAGLVVYWVVNNTWTLAQQFVIWRFAPTPGSPAARRRSAVG